MSGRPAIRIEIIRKIMIEAGHRCAACGTPCPLEKAHIVPWSKSKDHSAENLICLCANCHERADNEPWDQRTLEQYKRNPWVNRQFGNSPPESNQRRKEVQVTIDLSRADFDETEELWIRHGVASFLDIPAQQVKIVSIKDGSVKVVLSLPESSANQLLNCVESDWSRVERTFAPLRIRNIELVPENAEPASARKAIHVALEEIPMAALVRGDQRAWESLYHHIWPLVLRFLKSRGTEPFDAEDIAISVMERLYHMRDRIDSVGLVPHLALAIAHHRRTDSYRMALRRQPEGRLRLNLSELVDSIDEPALQGAESVVPSRAIQMSEARSLLEKAMQELDSVTKNIIEDRYLGELTSKQIAEKYEMNEHAVRARMARGIKKLREAIASSEELTSELRGILSGTGE